MTRVDQSPRRAGGRPSGHRTTGSGAPCYTAVAELLAQHRRILDAIDPIVTRAQEAGVLRDDVTTLDVLGLTKAAVACIPPSPDLRADGWRRSLALMLDGLRPGAATPLPVPPLTYEEVERALAATDSAFA